MGRTISRVYEDFCGQEGSWRLCRITNRRATQPRMTKGVLRCVQTGQGWPPVICDQFNGIFCMWVDHTLRSKAHRSSKAAAVGESEGEQLLSYPGTVAGRWGIDGEDQDPWNVLQLLSCVTNVLCMYRCVYTCYLSYVEDQIVPSESRIMFSIQRCAYALKCWCASRQVFQCT